MVKTEKKHLKKLVFDFFLSLQNPEVKQWNENSHIAA